MRCFSLFFPLAATAARAGAAAFAAIRTADAFDTLLLGFIDISCGSAQDYSQQDNQNNIFHRYLAYQLVKTNFCPEKQPMFPLVFLFLYLNGSCQLIVDAVSAVLNGDHTGASAAGDHGNGLPSVAAQRKQEGIQFFILCGNVVHHIFSTQLCFPKCHNDYPFSVSCR